MDSSPATLLPLEAMGSPWIQRAAQTRRKPRLGLEHSEVGARAMAFKPQSRIDDCFRGSLLCKSRVTSTVRTNVMVTESPWYVIRMPGGVGGEGSRDPSLSRFSASRINTY